ncbi:MAG: glucose-1-phosphate thymidylyltransferase RfbA, partial [Pseudomonadota bacterium]
MKGIILAGGAGTRLAPMTRAISKQILPIYDKPMIYYPLSVLMHADIQEILIISTARDIPLIKNLLGDGSDYGLKLSYKIQDSPDGIAQSFIIGEEFINGSKVSLILGDNIFYGRGMISYLQKAKNFDKGGCVFSYHVQDPERYGVVEFNDKKQVISIEEKPAKPKSNWAITGLYFYDSQVVNIAKSLKPSNRGELEITDVNKHYLENNQLKVEYFGRGIAWLDTGTPASLLNAAQFIRTIEERQGLKIACIEEISFQKNWIDKEQLMSLANTYGSSNKNPYGDYLRRVALEGPDSIINTVVNQEDLKMLSSDSNDSE